MDFHNPALLPLIPAHVLRERQVHEPYDTRYRAAARLLQALWRERRDLPMGHYEAASGRRRVGSMLAPSVARDGANFLGAEIFGQVRCDLAYREPGALIDVDRVWANLLSSMPLTFNLLAPLKVDKALARRVLNRLTPGFVQKVIHLQFEHSPGRGDPAFTADGTAFDAFIAGRSADNAKVFVAVEIKYSEGVTEPEPRLRPRYDQLSRDCGLYREPDAERLRHNPLQQFWRQHMLAQSMVDTGLYDAGVFVLIAPRQNREVQRAAQRYGSALSADASKVAFVRIDLEDAVDAFRKAGAVEHAGALHARYCDFSPVHDLVRAACLATPRRARTAGSARQRRQPGPRRVSRTIARP